MRKLIVGLSALVIPAVIAGFTVTGCDENGTGLGGDALLKQCGLTCPEAGVAEGNATISGVASIDSFFGSVVDYSATVSVVVDGIAKPMANIKAMLLLDADATPAEVIAAMKAKFGITGDIKIVATPPKCEISASATVEATAKCDADVTAGEVSASCTGSCKADVNVSGGEVSCSGDASIKCTAPSVSAECSGSCKGECKMDATLECSGTCKGECDGECSLEDGDGNCAGACTGKCNGSCEITGGASCKGTCEGECTIEGDAGGCEGGAKVECVVEPPEGSASVECSGKCEGEITPPKASVECEASAKASAEMKAECTPPSVEVTAELEANASAEVQAEFDAFMVNFKAEMGAMLAGLKRADIVARAGLNVVQQTPEVLASFKAKASATGELDLKTVVGLGCAVAAMDDVESTMTASTKKLAAQVEVSGEFVAAFK